MTFDVSTNLMIELCSEQDVQFYNGIRNDVSNAWA